MNPIDAIVFNLPFDAILTGRQIVIRSALASVTHGPYSMPSAHTCMPAIKPSRNIIIFFICTSIFDEDTKDSSKTSYCLGLISARIGCLRRPTRAVIPHQKRINEPLGARTSPRKTPIRAYITKKRLPEKFQKAFFGGA